MIDCLCCYYGRKPFWIKENNYIWEFVWKDKLSCIVYTAIGLELKVFLKKSHFFILDKRDARIFYKKRRNKLLWMILRFIITSLSIVFYFKKSCQTLVLQLLLKGFCKTINKGTNFFKKWSQLKNSSVKYFKKK